MTPEFHTQRNSGAIVKVGMSIRRDIPMPGFTRQTKYPFKDMDIGDCLVLAYGHPGTTKSKSGVARAQQSAYNFGRNNDKKFRGQRQPDGSLHIWRVE
jgi:hypothetical protein